MYIISGSAIEVPLNASGVKGKFINFGVANGPFKNTGLAKFSSNFMGLADSCF